MLSVTILRRDFRFEKNQKSGSRVLGLRHLKRKLPPMNVETLTRLILKKMPDIGKWQRDFMIHLMPLLLTVRGRHNFENLSRYGSFNEATYRVRYEGEFAFD